MLYDDNMIRNLSGKIVLRSDSEVVIDVNGVGFLVFVSPHTSADLIDKEEVSLWTHLAVRENALDLYGFHNREELRFFQLLLTISGIGPKSALNIMSISSVEEIKRAVRENHPAYLTKISGIGTKTAQKIVLELKDKIGESEEGGTEALKGEVEAIEALKSLGYSTQIAREALRDIPRDITETSERVREALKKLGS